MKASQTRSLAYLMAKTITLDEISTVSGGAQGAPSRWCHQETMKASGSGAHNVDVLVDWTVDF